MTSNPRQQSTHRPARAAIQLALLEAEARHSDPETLRSWARGNSLGGDAPLDLEALLDKTLLIGGRVVEVGRVICHQLQQFTLRHPGLATGIAVLAGLYALVSAVPLIGSFLALPLTVIAGPFAIGTGRKLDRDPGYQGRGYVGGAVTLAYQWLTHLIEIFRTLFKGERYVAC